MSSTKSSGGSKLSRDLTAFFGSLDKAIRGNRLYQGEGEIVDRQLADLVTRAGTVTEHTSVTIKVTPFGIVHEGETVTPSDQRISYLFRLFCDGVREITLSPGLGEKELKIIIDVLKTDLREDSEDLVTLLWKQNLKHLRYYAVDSFAAGSDQDASGQSAASGKDTAQLDRDAAGEVELALTAGDLRSLRTDDLLDWVRQSRAPSSPAEQNKATAEALKESYSAPNDHQRFIQIAISATKDETTSVPNAMVIGVFDSLLGSGNVEGLAALLNGISEGEAAAGSGLALLRTELTKPERLQRLAPVYSRNLDVLTPVLGKLASFARQGLVELLTTLPSGEAESRLQDVLAEAGIDLTPFYTKRLASPNEKDIIAAIKSLGRIGSKPALEALGEALKSTLSTVRRAALEAMDGRYDPAQRVALARVLKDPDPQNRKLALEIIAQSGDKKMCWSLLSLAQDASFNSMSLEEQALIFNTLGAFKDNRTLSHFDKLLSAKGIGRKGAAIERQKLVVTAVATTATPEAKVILEKHVKRWFLNAEVKSAIKSALSSWSS